MERVRGTVEAPVYRSVLMQNDSATPTFFVVCDEGWREHILCGDMYEWAADWLVEQLQGKPFPKSKSEKEALCQSK